MIVITTTALTIRRSSSLAAAARSGDLEWELASREGACADVGVVSWCTVFSFSAKSDENQSERKNTVEKCIFFFSLPCSIEGNKLFGICSLGR